MQRVKPANNEIYHVYNRGVEKRDVFINGKDYLRFIHDLHEFNNIFPAENSYYLKNKSFEVGLRKTNRKRELLVEIYAFCLMPNHFHLMLRQYVEGGITEFMRKIGTGYTNYFNQKYERVGSLFQGKYKLVRLDRQAYFFHLPNYIHLNPLGIGSVEWQNDVTKNLEKAMEFLESYKWSSFLDYIGNKNFPSVINKDFLTKVLGSPSQYKKEVKRWLKEINLVKIEKYILE